jgi:hypothetical protein
MLRSAMLAVIRWRVPFARPTRWLLGLAVMLALTALTIGCDANSGSRALANSGLPEESKTYADGQRSASVHTPQMGRAPYEFGLAVRGSRRTGRSKAATPAPSPAGRVPRSIPGMNAAAVATTFMKPGLECFEPVDRGVLYACTGEDKPNLTLRYEGEVSGSAADRVSGVEARVHRRGSANFRVASQPFLGLLATHLKYSGADQEEAYTFVNQNLNSKEATIVIGTAEWTITTSRDRKVLVVAPAH